MLSSVLSASGFWRLFLTRPSYRRKTRGSAFGPKLLREQLKRAIELRLDFPESYSLLAFVSLITGDEQDLDEGIASMKRVLRDAPARGDLTLMLAQLYMRKAIYKAARPLFEELAKSNPSAELRKAAQELLSQLDELEKKKSELKHPENGLL